MDRKARAIFALSVLVPVLFLAVGLMPGGNKGVLGDLYVISLPLIFPYALLALLAYGDSYAPFAVVAIVQFPLYALVWYRLRMKGLSRTAGWSLAASHLVAAISAFLVFVRFYGR